MGSNIRPIWLIEKELQDKKSRGEKVNHADEMIVKYFKKDLEKEEKTQKLIRDKINRNLGYIHTVGEIAEKLQFCEKTIYNMIDEDLRKGKVNILWCEFDLLKEGNEYLFQKGSLYKFISKNTHKYINGKKSPCKYDRLPEYLTINDCAKMKGLENGRQFRRSYVDKYIETDPKKYIKIDHKVLEGVEILKIGSTVRIEKASFELWIKSEGEKAT